MSAIDVRRRGGEYKEVSAGRMRKRRRAEKEQAGRRRPENSKKGERECAREPAAGMQRNTKKRPAGPSGNLYDERTRGSKPPHNDRNLSCRNLVPSKKTKVPAFCRAFRRPFRGGGKNGTNLHGVRNGGQGAGSAEERRGGWSTEKLGTARAAVRCRRRRGRSGGGAHGANLTNSSKTERGHPGHRKRSWGELEKAVTFPAMSEL